MERRKAGKNGIEGEIMGFLSTKRERVIFCF
jgi:hypothetical protein